MSSISLQPDSTTSLADLDKLAEGLLDNPNVVIELKSHTDYIGSIAQNNKFKSIFFILLSMF